MRTTAVPWQRRETSKLQSRERKRTVGRQFCRLLRLQPAAKKIIPHFTADTVVFSAYRGRPQALESGSGRRCFADFTSAHDNNREQAVPGGI